MSRFEAEQILGIRFFNGSAAEAVGQVSQGGGLLVAPSGTCFERLLDDEDYRRAVTTADVALADSGFMVLLWRLLRGRRVQRISGLAYLHALLADAGFRSSAVLWILPNERAKQKLLDWARAQNRQMDAELCYTAPMYGRLVQDATALALIAAKQPSHIVIGIGAGPQEKLGWHLRAQAAAHPAIHCIGGALGFITGDQVAIPGWADRLYLGWLLRLLTQPRIFLPRLWRGRVLPSLIARYGRQLPPLRWEMK